MIFFFCDEDIFFCPPCILASTWQHYWTTRAGNFIQKNFYAHWLTAYVSRSSDISQRLWSPVIAVHFLAWNPELFPEITSPLLRMHVACFEQILFETRHAKGHEAKCLIGIFQARPERHTIEADIRHKLLLKLFIYDHNQVLAIVFGA